MAVLTLDDAVVDASRKKMADSAARSPARLCSRDWKLCCHRRLEYEFLALLPSPSLSGGMFLSFVLLCSSSEQQSSAAPLRQVRVLLADFFCILVSSVFCLISGVVWFYLFYIFLVVLIFVVGMCVVLVMVSPPPCCGVMIGSKCPLLIPGRRHRLPGCKDSVAPAFRRHPARKQATNMSNYNFQASVKHLGVSD